MTNDSHSNSAFPGVSVDAGPTESTDGIEFAVELVEGFGERSPATLDVSVSSTTERTQTLEFGHTPPFTEYWSSSSDDGGAQFVLVPVNTHGRVVPEAPTDGCWFPTGPVPKWQSTSVVDLPAGESIEGRYALLASPTNDPCFPPGDYRFRSEEPLDRPRAVAFTVSLA